MINDPQIKAASDLLVARMQEFMANHNIPSGSALARETGLPEGSVNGYLYRGRLPEPGYLRRLCEKITTITDADAKILAVASSRNISLSRSHAGAQPREGKPRSKGGHGTLAKEPPVNSQPHPAQVLPGRDVLTEVHVGRLVMELWQALVPAGAQTQAVSLWAQDQSPYAIGDMPAVLTKDNFREIDASSLPAEEKDKLVAYANRAFEEARKCLVLLAQLAPADMREEMLARLKVNATLLWRTYKVAKHVVPEEFLKDIDLALMCEKLPLPKTPIPTGAYHGHS